MATKFYNKPTLKKYRRSLRTNMTKSERVLWSRLRRNQMQYKFRRQYSIGNYIVDFYCDKLNLAIEVDGMTHYNENVFEKDCIRQKYLESLGIRMLRFNSEDVFKRIEQISEQIYLLCQEMGGDSTPS